MKANRKAIYNDEEAVSPVIAVILMVAITVVLAATVFVLVNELGQDVGQTGPQIGLTTASASDGLTGNWTVRVTSATLTAPLSEFTCILTVPNGTTYSATTCANNVALGTDGHRLWHTSTGSEATQLSVGDRLAASGDFSDTGSYSFELIHRPTGTSSGSITRAF